jgi:hypothetical protein
MIAFEIETGKMHEGSGSQWTQRTWEISVSVSRDVFESDEWDGLLLTPQKDDHGDHGDSLDL